MLILVCLIQQIEELNGGQADTRSRERSLEEPLVAPDRLRLARELRGWTQQELIAQAGHEFTAPALSQLEQGRTRPSPTTLLAIARATDCPVEFFVPNTGLPSLNSAPGSGFSETGALLPFTFLFSSSRLRFSASTALIAAACCVFRSSRLEPVLIIDSVYAAS